MYVDDIMIIGEKNVIDYFMRIFGDRFSCRTYSVVYEFIGCQISWNNNGSEVIFHQTRMINKLEVNVKYLINEWKVRDITTPFLIGTVIEHIKE